MRTIPLVHVYRTDYGDVELGEREAMILRLEEGAQQMGLASLSLLTTMADQVRQAATARAYRRWRWQDEATG